MKNYWRQWLGIFLLIFVANSISLAQETADPTPLSQSTKIPAKNRRSYLPKITLATISALIFANINPTVAAITIGGGLGALSRYAVSWEVNSWVRGSHNGTFAVNILGSFLFGAVSGIAQNGFGAESAWLDFMTIGFLGAFTTFSTLTYDAVYLAREDGLFFSAAYIGTSLIAGVAALLAGEYIGTSLFP